MAVIGREPPSDIIVASKGVSSRHAEIVEIGEGRYKVRDLGSTNGVYVNGHKVAEAEVTLADEIKLGRTVFDLPSYAAAIGGEQADGPAKREASDNELVIGRDPDCDIVVADRRVSSRHLAVTVSGDGYHIRDLGSTNGSYVNGHKISEKRVMATDRVSLGTLEVDLPGLIRSAGSGAAAGRDPGATVRIGPGAGAPTMADMAAPKTVVEGPKKKSPVILWAAAVLGGLLALAALAALIFWVLVPRLNPQGKAADPSFRPAGTGREINIVRKGEVTHETILEVSRDRRPGSGADARPGGGRSI